MLSNKKGFTLIELVMIIVILGILAAVAIPRYTDLVGDADKANAKAVIGGLNSAASIAFAAKLTGNTRCNSIGASTLITTTDQLAGCLDGGLPKGWSSSDPNFTYTSSGGTTYTFPMTDEQTTSKASVQRTGSGGVANWPEN